MKSVETWASAIKQQLEQSGFKVRMIDPSLAKARKTSARRRDRRLIKTGAATAGEIQQKNAAFPNAGRKVRILDYGSLERASANQH